MSEFTCFKCLETFSKRNDKEWNDYKASEEFLTLYPEGKNDSVDILCDDCNEEFKAWFSTLTTEQKIQMREDYNKEVKW